MSPWNKKAGLNPFAIEHGNSVNFYDSNGYMLEAIEHSDFMNFHGSNSHALEREEAVREKAKVDEEIRGIR